MGTSGQAPAVPGERMMLRATKYDGSPHWIQPFKVISDDGTLLVASYRARTPIFTSRGEFRSPYDSRVYLWRDRWYNVFRLSRPGAEPSLWYCNITTPPTYRARTLEYVDLDLDVAVRPDGWVETLDEAEFVRHRDLYAYPPELVEQALAAAEQVTQLARGRGFPFDQK